MNTPNIVWLLIFYIVGWISGYLSHKERTKEFIETATKRIKKTFDIEPVGPVNRPTAKELYDRTDPRAKIIKETEDAMKDIFAKVKGGKI